MSGHRAGGGDQRYVVSRLVEALNEDSKSLKGARVLVLGLSYKANIDDTRRGAEAGGEGVGRGG